MPKINVPEELPESIASLAADMIDLSIQNIVKDGKLDPVGFLLDDQRKVIILDIRDAINDTQALATTLRRYAQEHKLLAIFLFVESWGLDAAHIFEALQIKEALDKHVAKDKAAEKEFQETMFEAMTAIHNLFGALFGRIENMPFRQEGVVFTLSTIWGEFTGITTTYRDADGKIEKMGDIKWTHAQHTSGRLTNLIGINWEEQAKWDKTAQDKWDN
jgi:hypothetical protein